MPNEVMPWLLDGLGGVILGVIVTCLVLHLQSQKRVLTYEVELMPVFRALRGFDDLIQVKYDDVLVDNLYSCRVVVRNSGTVPLLDQPVLIQLEENVTVLEERFETKPALEFGEIRVDEEALAFDVIKQVGPAGHFVSARHTRKHIRTEQYQPTLSDRENFEAWEAKGKKDTCARARERVEEILSAPGYHLPDEARQRILREIPGIIE